MFLSCVLSTLMMTLDVGSSFRLSVEVPTANTLLVYRGKFTRSCMSALLLWYFYTVQPLVFVEATITYLKLMMLTVRRTLRIKDYQSWIAGKLETHLHKTKWRIYLKMFLWTRWCVGRSFIHHWSFLNNTVKNRKFSSSKTKRLGKTISHWKLTTVP